MTEDTAAITVPLDLFKRLVVLAADAFPSEQVVADIAAASREIEQVEALLASQRCGQNDHTFSS